MLIHVYSNSNISNFFIVCSYFPSFWFDMWRKRLASLEIARFQEQLIKRLTEEMASQLDNMSPAASAVMVPQPSLHDYEWTFSRSFFYSLTILSTIGKFFPVIYKSIQCLRSYECCRKQYQQCSSSTWYVHQDANNLLERSEKQLIGSSSLEMIHMLWQKKKSVHAEQMCAEVNV